MIENFQEKLKANKIEIKQSSEGFEFSEEKFHEDTGEKYLKPIGFFGETQIEALITDRKHTLADLQNRARSIKAEIAGFVEMQRAIKNPDAPTTDAPAKKQKKGE